MKESRLFEKKEALRYFFWGVVTVLVNYFSYFLLKQILTYQIANLISIVFTKVFAYYTNKTFVFRTKTSVKGQVLEVFRYVMGRGITGLVDFVGLIVLVDAFGVDDGVGKVVMIVITTALNYVLGKTFVFKKDNTVETSASEE